MRRELLRGRCGVNEEKKSVHQIGCLAGIFIRSGIIAWAFGAAIVGLGVWEKTQNLLDAIGTGIGWPYFLPFMLLEFIAEGMP